MMRRLLLAAVCAPVLGFLLLPIVTIVAVSFTSGQFLEFPVPGVSLRWYADLMSRPEWVAAGVKSLVVAGATVAVSLVLGLLAALGLAGTRPPGAGLVRGLILSPLIMPKIVAAIALYLVVAPLGLVGTNIGLVLAHVVLAVPFVFVVLSAAILRYDVRQNWAGMSMGATPWQTFRLVMLPALYPSLVAAALFAFLASFDDVIIAYFINGISSNTLPTLMYASVQEEITPTLAAASTLLVCVTTLLGAAIALASGERRPRQPRSRPAFEATGEPATDLP